MDATCPKCTAQSFDAALELQLLLHHLDSDLLAAGILQEAFVSLEDAFVVGPTLASFASRWCPWSGPRHRRSA